MEPLNNLTVNIRYGGEFQKIKLSYWIQKKREPCKQGSRSIQQLVLPKFDPNFIYIKNWTQK